MKTPSESRAKFGKQLDGFAIELAVEVVWLILELALLMVSSL